MDPRNISVVEWEEGEKKAIDVRPQRYGPSSDPSSVWHFADSDGVELKPISTEGTLLSCVPSLDHTEPHSDPTSFVSGEGGMLKQVQAYNSGELSATHSKSKIPK